MTEAYNLNQSSPTVEIDAKSLTIENVIDVARNNFRVTLSAQAIENIRKRRAGR